MKKVLALFFALVLCLPLSPAAFAAEEEEVELADYTYESAKEVIAAAGWEGISFSVAQRKFWLPAGLTRMELTEGAKQTLTSCAQAITAAELQAVVDADERIENLTVFRQRNIEEAEGCVDISVKLWPCAPEKHPAHATVILFRAEGEETWTVAGYAADEVCDATLTGNGAYVVCLAW